MDADCVDGLTRVGTLAHDRGQIRFHYEASWLKNPAAFCLDPQLTLDKAPFFPIAEASNFGVFLDSSPDRWGRTLMKRREALEAKDEGRAQRQLYAWDFLLGVQDFTRQGALRFKFPGSSEFLGAHKLPAPPVSSLRELENIAFELSAKKIENLDALREWLAVLVAPGASLGGARPKANFTAEDGTLWIAKFPARDDTRDIGAWEAALHTLAEKSGVDVPPCRALRLSSEFHTFCAQRFDRASGRRKFYSSAMTMLQKSDGDSGSYLEVAEFLRKNGAKGHIADDLGQLFRRVVFNVMAGHRDDHLRNHGFIMTAHGWRLSPAFDLNPIIDKPDHVLALDDADNRPSIGTVLSTSELYGLTASQAEAIVEQIRGAVRNWPQVAKKLGISSADIDLTEAAFGAIDREPAPVAPARP